MDDKHHKPDGDRSHIQIIQNDSIEPVRRPSRPHTKTVTIPIWALVVTGLVMLLIVAMIAIFALLPEQGQTGQSGIDAAQSAQDAPSVPETPYLAFEAARDKALDYAGFEETAVVFLKTKLAVDANPVVYEIAFLDDNHVEYRYIIHAMSGALIRYDSMQVEAAPDRELLVTSGMAHKLALEAAGLSDALFLKEKLSDAGAYYVYKLEFEDGNRHLYTVHLHAETGELLKYSVEEIADVPAEQLITLEAARKTALIRAGGIPENQVIFTKGKLEGTVYLIGFTHEDGTQYTVEINAKTGNANTLDVIPVSANTAAFIGMLKAKDIALAQADIAPNEPVTFTKAKMDREHAAYIYQIEFETEDYEYEVKVHTETGAVLEYRAWFR